MRDAVKTVAPYAVFGQILVRQSIGVGMRGQGVVECGVKDRDVFYFWQVLARGADSGQIMGIVEGGERAEFFDVVFHFVVNQHGGMVFVPPRARCGGQPHRRGVD